MIEVNGFSLLLYYGSLLLQHARHSPSARNRNGGLIHTVLFSTTHVCAWCLAGGGTDGPLIAGFGGCAIFGVFGWCLFSTSPASMIGHDYFIYKLMSVPNNLTLLTGRQVVLSHRIIQIFTCKNSRPSEDTALVAPVGGCSTLDLRTHQAIVVS